MDLTGNNNRSEGQNMDDIPLDMSQRIISMEQDDSNYPGQLVSKLLFRKYKSIIENIIEQEHRI